MQLKTILGKSGRIWATENALKQLETILCEFGRICATRNALMQLETILCEFWQLCATWNALKQLKTILCEFGQICATGNPFQSILNFPPILEQECAEPFCVVTWWLITQPRSIWKKAPPGLQWPSHLKAGLLPDSWWPTLLAPPIGPAPRGPRPDSSRLNPIIN